MHLEIPLFKYHPYPLKTGNVVQKAIRCICCDHERAYAYIGPVHSTLSGIEDNICIWCIADGSAAKKFDAEFAGDLDQNLSLPAEIMEEFTKKTPGYISWQGEIWLTHCDDICEFHGDFSKEELLQRFDELTIYAKDSLHCGKSELKEIIKYYNPKQGNINPAFYKFVCRKCDKILFHCDFT
jgi:uncharacterized protein CbrC (UPF0167 family)